MGKDTKVTNEMCDRLLGLGDQALEDWQEQTRDYPEDRVELEERCAEWNAARPVMAVAPELLAAMRELIDDLEGRLGEGILEDIPAYAQCVALLKRLQGPIVAPENTASPALKAALEAVSKMGKPKLVTGEKP